MHLFKLFPCAFAVLGTASTTPYHEDLALRMLSSIRERGQVVASSSGGTSLIQLASHTMSSG